MKFILSLVLLISLQTSAQKKPVKKDPPPSQKEMNEMMKEMEDAFNNMSPEEKRFMDSMGIKMPNVKQMKKTADFAMANSGLQPEVLVPKRDAVRIASISKLPLTKTALPAYLQSVHQKLQSRFPSSMIVKADELYKSIKSKYGSTMAVANAAVGFWAFGKAAPALLLMSNACVEAGGDTDYLNNFAAMLSMSGGEQLALPLLNYLNKQYPQNSTILNNIAHAWFGLGDIPMASKYIDSTIRLCAWHPQANQIKAAIEENKGNHTAAIKSMKQSISRMHTSDKERKLNDLGYELKPDDIFFNPPRKKDELGLSKFKWPSFPKNVEESRIMQVEWEQFRKECNRIASELSEEGVVLGAAFQKGFQERLKQDANAPKTGARTSAVFVNLSPKAEKKLRPRIDELLAIDLHDPFGIAVIQMQRSVDSLKEIAGKEMRELDEQFRGKMGEGLGIPEAYCSAYDAINNRLLMSANSVIESFFKKHLDRVYTRINEVAHYNLYRAFPEELAFNINLAKQEWIGMLRGPIDNIVFRDPTTLCRKSNEKPTAKFGALPDYDEVNCRYKSEMNFGYASIKTECGRMIAEIEIDFVKLGWETKSADLEANRNFFDEFQRCTIEVSAGTSKKFGEGPLQLQTSAEVTGFIEIDRTGVKDAGVKLTANAGVKTNTLNTKVETDIGEVNVGPKEPSVSLGGVNATISINSGFTATGSGILKGIKL